jgi:hypothetical protein
MAGCRSTAWPGDRDDSAHYRGHCEKHDLCDFQAARDTDRGDPHHHLVEDHPASL